MDSLREEFELAIAAYWQTKSEQKAAAQRIRSTAEGTAKTVRGGGQLNPLITLISRLFTDAGYPAASVGITKRQVTLPGFFRPNKQWDLVVVHEGVLVAAIEMKALGGPSFGNNYNNRVEEAIGTSADIARAYREGLTGSEKPWLGYFFLMEDHPKSRTPVSVQKGPFEADDLWFGRSYQERYEFGAKRLLEAQASRVASSTWLVWATHRDTSYADSDDELGAVAGVQLHHRPIDRGSSPSSD